MELPPVPSFGPLNFAEQPLTHGVLPLSAHLVACVRCCVAIGPADAPYAGHMGRNVAGCGRVQRAGGGGGGTTVLTVP